MLNAIFFNNGQILDIDPIEIINNQNDYNKKATVCSFMMVIIMYENIYKSI